MIRPFRETITQQEERAKVPFSARLLGFCKTLGRWLFLWVCSLATAWLVWQSYPSISRNELAWLSLAPFIWGITRTKVFWSSFFYSWVTALLFNAGIFEWIYTTCFDGGGLSREMSLAAWWGLSGLMALPFACFGASCFYLRKTHGFFPLLAACAFVSFEWLHQTIAFYGLGFPWVMLGYTQWNAPEMIQLAAYTGTYGISFVIVFISASVGWAFADKGFKSGVSHMLLATAVFVAVYFFGQYHLPSEKHKKFQPLLSLKTAIVQPNIDQYKKWTPEFEEEIAATLADMGKQMEQKNINLAVWPESSIPTSLEDEKYQTLFSDFVTNTGASQVVGSNLTEGIKQYVVTAFISPLEKPHFYRKQKLVPFGEYIPLESFLRSLFKDVAVLGALGSFSAGEGEQPLASVAGISFGQTICYESIYPQLWHKQNKQGARFFVNVTNDAWFFDTAAPHQHLAVNVLRAVETGRPVLRAANTGFSAFIDPFGRIEQKTKLFVKDMLITDVPLAVGENKNFYTQWGDWFAWLCATVFFSVFISLVVFSYE